MVMNNEEQDNSYNNTGAENFENATNVLNTQEGFDQSASNISQGQENTENIIIDAYPDEYGAVKKLGIACLVLGIISTLLWLPIGPWSPMGYGIAGWVLGMGYELISVIIAVICFVLLVGSIIGKKRSHLKGRVLLVLPISGFVLSLSFWIFLAVFSVCSILISKIG